jgi:hypothetical protein
MRRAVVLGILAVGITAAACRPVSPPPRPPSPPTPSTPLRTGTQNGSLGSCPVFPANNPWNTNISTASVHPSSSQIINRINSQGGDFLHADFGGNGAYGIPYVTVGGTEPTVRIRFTAYGDESDPGPYPAPLGAPIEGGRTGNGDRHVIAVNTGTCKLYEMYRAFPRAGYWDADAGAVFNLRSNALRPDYWTSADAAGLPIFAGLARYDEVARGSINHALRVTFDQTRRAFLHPATHFASSSTYAFDPPMGMRLRLKSSYVIPASAGSQARVILTALKKYGLIVADNGSNWFITGAADRRWNDNDLNLLKSVPGSAFEVVNTGEALHT